MISVRKNSGEVVILGTDQEKLLLSVIESAIHLQITPNPGSDDDRDLTKLRRLKSIVDADTPLERDHEPR